MAFAFAYARPRSPTVVCRLCGLQPAKGVPVHEVNVILKGSKQSKRSGVAEVHEYRLEEAVVCHKCHTSGAIDKFDQIHPGSSNAKVKVPRSSGGLGLRSPPSDIIAPVQPSSSSAPSTLTHKTNVKLGRGPSGLGPMRPTASLPRPRSPRLCNKDKKEPVIPLLKKIEKRAVPPKSHQPKEKPVSPTKPPAPSLEFQCTYCPSSFATKTSRCDHVTYHHHHLNTLFMCNLCLNFFTSKEEEVEHKRTEHKDHLICFYCLDNFETYDQKVDHLKKDHGEGAIRYKCNDEICKKLVYWSPEELGEHVHLVHHRNKGLTKCIFCNKLVVSLHRHVMHLHKEEAIKCSYHNNCRSYFKTKEEMLKHVQNEHTAPTASPSLASLRSYVGYRPIRPASSIINSVPPVVDIMRWCVFCETLVVEKNLEGHIAQCHLGESVKYEFADKGATVSEAEVKEEVTEFEYVEISCLDS